MTALGNVPCNGCSACCLHDMIPLMPERGDLIWTYKHEVVATAAGPKAVLQCGETGECIYLGRDGCTIHDRAPAICRAITPAPRARHRSASDSAVMCWSAVRTIRSRCSRSACRARSASMSRPGWKAWNFGREGNQVVLASLRGAKATKQSSLSLLCSPGLLRGACDRARIRATRWFAITL